LYIIGRGKDEREFQSIEIFDFLFFKKTE